MRAWWVTECGVGVRCTEYGVCQNCLFRLDSILMRLRVLKKEQIGNGAYGLVYKGKYNNEIVVRKKLHGEQPIEIVLLKRQG